MPPSAVKLSPPEVDVSLGLAIALTLRGSTATYMRCRQQRHPVVVIPGMRETGPNHSKFMRMWTKDFIGEGGSGAIGHRGYRLSTSTTKLYVFVAPAFAFQLPSAPNWNTVPWAK